MPIDGKAGDGAREVYTRRVAARLRRLHAAGATADELIAALDDSPAHELAWATGADGEAAVAAVLDAAAARRGFGVLHDLRIPGQFSNIDHVVVGAGGITVIDTKAWSGTVRVAGGTLRVGGWRKHREAHAVERQVASITEVLRGSGIGAPVAGMLCLANRNTGGMDTLRHVGPIAVGTPEAVADAVSRGSVCSRHEALVIMGLLEKHFRPRAVVAVGSGLSEPPARRAPAGTALSGRRGRLPRWEAFRRRSQTVRRGSAHRRGRRRSELLIPVVQLVGVLAMLFVAVHLLHAARPGGRLTAAAVLPMRVELQARAVAAAGGPVHGPSLTMTTARVRLRYRRGACRVLVTLDRARARTAADATVFKGERCPGS